MASRRIEDLHQDFQPMVRELLRRGSEQVPGFSFFITDGFRSMAEQEQLYKSGRSTTGKILTNARPGESSHNYGLGVDLAFQKMNEATGKWELKYDKELYAKIDPIARELGFVLGVDWRDFPDRPHFEYPNWRNKIKTMTTPTPAYPVTWFTEAKEVLVTHERGVNVRDYPETSAGITRTLPRGTRVGVIGEVEGEVVGGVNRWWITPERHYVWSGVAELVDNTPLPVPTPPPAQPMATETIEFLKRQLSDLHTEYTQVKKERDTFKVMADEATKSATVAETKLAGLQSDYEGITNLRNSNQLLTEANEIYVNKVGELRTELKLGKAAAFQGWHLMEIEPTKNRPLQLITLTLRLAQLILKGGAESHVVGWKPGGKIRRVES